MMKILIAFLSLLIISNIQATVINIPADYDTIQEGINNSISGDTLIAQPGIYTENINFSGKNITLASLFLTTQNQAYISQTVIDGNRNGSVVIFESGENSEAILCGLTIRNGLAVPTYPYNDSGGGVFIINSNPTLMNLEIIRNYASYKGGGVSLINSNATIIDSKIYNNTAQIFGGGIAAYDNSNLNLAGVTIKNNNALSFTGGGLALYSNSTVDMSPENRCNIYLNSAPEGTDIFIDDNNPNVINTYNIIVDTLTVNDPNEYFISSNDNDNLIIDMLINRIETVSEDLFVNPTIGSNENSGLSADEPLKSVKYALLKIDPKLDDSRLKISLANGVYSTSLSDENFPILCKDSIDIVGEERNSTIIDGENLNQLFFIPKRAYNLEIKNLTIKNGFAENGAGIYCHYESFVDITNVSLINNNAINRGGAIFCNESFGAANLSNVLIQGNSAEKGGGISCGFGYPTRVDLSNVTIKENSAINGGGIYWDMEELNFDPINLCNIYMNTSESGFGNDIYLSSMFSPVEVALDTFTVITPIDLYAFPIEDFDFDILNSYSCVNIENDNYELRIMNYELKQNYPNPFNPLTKINYTSAPLSDLRSVKIVVYNSVGQEVWSSHITDHALRVKGSILFDGSNLNSGIYYYSLVIDKKVMSTKSMLLIK